MYVRVRSKDMKVRYGDGLQMGHKGYLKGRSPFEANRDVMMVGKETI